MDTDPYLLRYLLTCVKVKCTTILFDGALVIYFPHQYLKNQDETGWIKFMEVKTVTCLMELKETFYNLIGSTRSTLRWVSIVIKSGEIGVFRT